MLLTMAYLGTIHPDLEHAARLVAGWRDTLWRVSLPIVFPGILLAVSLVFLLSMGEFGVPMFFRYDVLPVETFTQFSAFFDFGAATASAVPLLAVTMVVLGAERRLLGKSPRALRPFSAATEKIPLGKRRVLLAAIVGLGCLGFVLLPYSSLLIQAGSGPAYADAVRRAGDSLLRSILYGATGASKHLFLLWWDSLSDIRSTPDICACGGPSIR
jgi:ABC-type Fe3+ transport system permease subunit